MKQTMTERHNTASNSRAAQAQAPQAAPPQEHPTPQMTWVSVTDSRGRERLVARWSDPAMAQAPSAAHAA